ncbi:hypothetical protein EDB92DRAFT_2100808 [Lactarius akahatsu]|uniref:RNA-binding domain-containing protein n=1 Tax=Lactarius akahatsu TaxID=416441 RepID=A0AAD4LR06_9AGAM|nr:hypothetical protein EDB92DRAFT_2100808 [Lactarius akahatsu]
MSDAPAAPVTEQGVPPVTQSEEVPSFKVFVGNLAYSTTDEGLKAFFEPVQSDIISAQVILRGTRSAGYGFVAFSTAEAAQNAVELLDKKELDDRPIIVEIAKPADQKERERKDRKPPRRRTGRRGSKAVPGEVTEAEANGEVKTEDTPPAEGEATKPKKKKKKSARKPKATVAVTDGEAEPAAPSLEGEPKPARNKRTLRPRRAAGEEPTGEPSKSVLFVANLGFNIDDVALTALFTEAGINVVSARIVRRQYGRPRKSKGYGFVDVGNEDEQTKAIAALEGKDVGGRPIAVKIAVNAQSEEAKEEEAAVEEEGTPEIAIVDTDDDDYLSDKFLLNTDEPQKPKTYSEKRKEALFKSRLKNELNRTKSRRQLELESREEGLSKSLFERAEDETSGRGSENKALSMMLKMGFKPGQALGVTAHADEGSANPSSSPSPPPLDPTRTPQRDISPPQETSATQTERQLVNPLPLNEWSGTLLRYFHLIRRKGIGLGKRAPSPNELERLTKAAKVAEEADKESFRDRTRREFEQRRAEARLAPAQLTCASLDERAGKEFNVFWLNPTNPESFPAGLMEALSEIVVPAWRGDGSIEERLRTQMQADMLVPLDDDRDPPKDADLKTAPWAPETIEEAAQFLRLNPMERLSRVLQYLRAEYHYCFWCGTQYRSADEMADECPGPDEDMHD